MIEKIRVQRIENAETAAVCLIVNRQQILLVACPAVCESEREIAIKQRHACAHMHGVKFCNIAFTRDAREIYFAASAPALATRPS